MVNEDVFLLCMVYLWEKQTLRLLFVLAIIINQIDHHHHHHYEQKNQIKSAEK